MFTLFWIGVIGAGVYQVRKFVKGNPEKVNAFGTHVKEMFK